MKKLLLLLALSGCVAAGHAQEILLGTDFKMYFDNKEFGSNEFAVPGNHRRRSFAEFALSATTPMPMKKLEAKSVQ